MFVVVVVGMVVSIVVAMIGATAWRPAPQCPITCIHTQIVDQLALEWSPVYKFDAARLLALEHTFVTVVIVRRRRLVGGLL
jgi:hypothetical protein